MNAKDRIENKEELRVGCAGFIGIIVIVVMVLAGLVAYVFSSSEKPAENTPAKELACPYPLKEALVDSYVEVQGNVIEFTVSYPNKETEDSKVTETFKSVDLSKQGFQGMAGLSVPFELITNNQTPVCLFVSFHHRHYATLMPARHNIE